MITGLQTAPANDIADDLTPATPGVDRNSLKTVARIAGIAALASGGAALLLYALLRPKPEYEPTGSDRVVRSQSTDNATELRTQRPVRAPRPAAGGEEGLFAPGAGEGEEDVVVGQQQGAGTAEFVGPEFSDEQLSSQRRTQRGNGQRRSRQDETEQRAGALGENGEGADGLREGEFAEGVLEQGSASEASASGDLAQGDGTEARRRKQNNASSGARIGGAQPDEAAIDLDAAPPDVSEWLDGPIATLEELPLLQQQADTLPEQRPEDAIAAAQPAPQDGIYVENFIITGNSVFSQEELAQVARAAVFTDDATDAAAGEGGQAGSQVGMVLSPAELVQASDAITAFYTQQGYVNSGAYVPEAVLQGAPPEIRVIEGKLESINVTVEPFSGFGLARPMSAGYVEGRLAQAGSGTLNLDRLVDGVRLLELDPLIDSIATELVPGSVTGSSVLNVTVKQAKSFAGGLTLNNYRSPSIGSFTQGLSMQQSNILRTGDNAQLGYSRSSGSNSLDLGYSIPINAKDGTLSLRHSRNSSRVVEQPFDAFDATSRSRLTELKFRQPLVKKPNEELAASLTLSRYFSRGRIFNEQFPLPSDSANEEGETRVSALRFGQEWTRKGEKQFMALQSQFSLGLGSLLGGDVRREDPDNRFLAWRGQGRLVRALGPDAIASLKGEVQLSPTSLVPVERFSVGGPTTVRGYRQNALLTDGGWLMSAEAQVPVMRFPKWKSVVQLAPFVDMGGGWNMGGNQPEQSFLASTGIGAILRVGDDFSARLDYGIPITNHENNGSSLQDSGVSFSINLTPF